MAALYRIPQLRLEAKETQNTVEKLARTTRHLDNMAEKRCVSNFVYEYYCGIRGVKTLLQGENLVRWLYGCAAHFLNIITKDIAKLLFKDFIKKSVFIVNKSKNKA